MTEPKQGTLFALSLGPGDPDLITRKAWGLLNQPSVWAYPIRRAGAQSYALQIVTNAGLEVPENSLALVFPMTHDKDRLSGAWNKAAQQVLGALDQGLDLCFLVEGDASTYSTFGHLSRSVRQLSPGVKVEVIPGVTSFNAAAARLGEPLADVDDKLAILPAGYGMEAIATALDQFDSLVLLKVKPLLEPIIDLLEERGLSTHSQFIEKAGSPEERVIREITTLRGTAVNYLSLILVKNPLREKSPLIRGCKPKPEEPNA